MAQHVFEASRGREKVGRADFTHVCRQSRRSFGAIDREAHNDRLGIGEDVIPHPSHGKIGDDLVIGPQTVEFMAHHGAGDDIAVRQHHPFGRPVVPEV